MKDIRQSENWGKYLQTLGWNYEYARDILVLRWRFPFDRGRETTLFFGNLGETSATFQILRSRTHPDASQPKTLGSPQGDGKKI